MTNNASAFDTLQAARDLKAAGIESEQAEALASKRGEAADTGRADLVTKADLTAAIAALETRLTNRLYAAVFAAAGIAAGIVIAAIKLL